jgi:hypothetical protein
MAMIFLLVFALVGVALYFLPTVIAAARNARHLGAIVVINLFLGWTFVGWVVALALAVASSSRTPPLPYPYPPPGGPWVYPPPASLPPRAPQHPGAWRHDPPPPFGRPTG